MRIIGLAGWSGSGKTTLITKVLPRLIARGQRVSTLKHAHHGFDLDQPGKDSFMHRAAGATEVVISSAKRFAVLHELRERAGMGPAGPAAASSRRSISCWWRASSATPSPSSKSTGRQNGKPLLHPDDPHIVAIAADTALPQATVPVIDLDDIERHRRRAAQARDAAEVRGGRAAERVMAQLTDDCFAFSGPLLPIAEMERLIAERVQPVTETETVTLRRRAAACWRPTSQRRSICRRSTIPRSTATPCATATLPATARRG